MVVDTTQLPTPIETVTPLKASEAVRLGILLAPIQGHSNLFGVTEGYGGTPDGTWVACAVGAAALGFGWRPPEAGQLVNPENSYDDEPAYDLVMDRIGRERYLRCPWTGPHQDSADDHAIPISHQMWHLNDYHRWSREKIAGWLEEHGY